MPGASSQIITVEIGKIWKTLTEDQKGQWKVEAERLNALE